MTIRRLAYFALLACVAAGLAGCDMPSPTPSDEPPPTLEQIELPVEEPPVEPLPELNPEVFERPPLESLLMPVVEVSEREVIYTHAERSPRGGRELYWWPDGMMGMQPLGSGLFRFFAANSSNIAITIGTLDDPATTVIANAELIRGVDHDEYPYAAGGPVYRDPETGMLLMFYHAEYHFPDGRFHAVIGLATSSNEGRTFNDLGIILTTQAERDPDAPCCADIGSGTYVIDADNPEAEGVWFNLYYRDRLNQDGALTDIHLAVATAPLDEVVEAARAGRTSAWYKVNGTSLEPGLGGLASPAEPGNPPGGFTSATHNTALNRYLLVGHTFPAPDGSTQLYLIASEDGFHWSPRVTLLDYEGEATYPTIIDPGGDPNQTGNTFYVCYITTPPGSTRWENTALERLTVTLTGEMVEGPSAWEFETDPGGWVPFANIDTERFEVVDGALVVEPTSNDPYMHSPILGLSTDLFGTIEVRMRTNSSGMAEFFYTTTDAPRIGDAETVRFPINGTGEFETYTVDMASSPDWNGHLGMLRFDPTDQVDRVDIDYIRLLP